MSQSSKPRPESTGSRFSITFAAPTYWTPE